MFTTKYRHLALNLMSFSPPKRSCCLVRAMTLMLLMGLFLTPAYAAVYVSFSTTVPALQTDFISMTTNQYLGVITPSPYFAGTYSILISSKQTNPPQTVCPPPTTTDQFLAITTTTLAALATDYYLNGWVNGQAYERYKNVGQLSGYYYNCSSTSFPAPTGTSTSTWVVPKLDTTTCTFLMGYISNNIYSQSFSSPTIVPGY